MTVTSNYTYADVDGQHSVCLERAAASPVSMPRPTTGSTCPATPAASSGRASTAARSAVAAQPAGGYVQNANNPPWWTSLRDIRSIRPVSAYIEQGALSLRAQVVLEALDTAPRLSPDDVRRLKFSIRMLVADLLLPDLLDAAASVGSPSERFVPGSTRWPRGIGRPAPAAAVRCSSIVFSSSTRTRNRSHSPRPGLARAPMTTPRGLANPASALAALEQAVARCAAAARR